jgi:AcrR family transcriptional regulator
MPKVVDSEQYRRELLHKCFDLLAEKGYANVTTRQLSKELGISTGAMYHYFSSKKALFEQLVEEMSRQDEVMLRAATEGAETLSERIAALGQFLIEHEAYFVKQAFIWLDFYQHTELQGILNNPVFRQVDEQYERTMTAILGLADPKVGRFVWTLISGVLVEQIDGRDSLPFVEQIDLLVKMLTAYFEKHGT